MRRFTSRSLIFDVTVALRVAMNIGRTTAIIFTFSYAMQRISLVSQIGRLDDILRKKLLISYIDQFVMPAKLQRILRDPWMDYAWQPGHPQIPGHPRMAWIRGWPRTDPAVAADTDDPQHSIVGTLCKKICSYIKTAAAAHFTNIYIQSR